MTTKIQNVDTGKIFTLSDEEAFKVVTSNRERFVFVEGEITVAKEVKEETKPSQTYNFDKMKLVELQEYCKDNEIEFEEKATKAQLVALIKEHK